MRNLLDILIISSLFLFFTAKSYSQIFYVNKELDFEKLVNFDLSKYTFEDYKKEWKGWPDFLGKKK